MDGETVTLQRRSFLASLWAAILSACGRHPAYASKVVDNTKTPFYPDNLFYTNGVLVSRSPGNAMIPGNRWYTDESKPVGPLTDTEEEKLREEYGLPRHSFPSH